jgi:hypothetical protein
MDSVSPTGGVGQSLSAEAVRRLRAFRDEAFGSLERRRDALFELVDALLRDSWLLRAAAWRSHSDEDLVGASCSCRSDETAAEGWRSLVSSTVQGHVRRLVHLQVDRGRSAG